MNLPMIPREGLPVVWMRFLHDSIIQILRVNRGVVGLPQVTTAQRDTIDAKGGDMVYNTTDSEAQVYENGSWRKF